MSGILATLRAQVSPKGPRQTGENPHENTVNPPKPGEVLTVELPKWARHRFGPSANKAIETVAVTVLVVDLEDKAATPWTVWEFLNQPTCFRGRWKIRSYEYAKRGWRNFYADWRTPCRLQLGLWNPLTNECVERIGEPYSQDAEGISELRDECRELMKEPPQPGDGVTMAIFAVA